MSMSTKGQYSPIEHSKNNATGSHEGAKKNPNTKRNMSERNRETPSPWNLTNDTNELFYRKETHGLEYIFLVASLEGEGVGRTGIRRVKIQTLALGVGKHSNPALSPGN